MFEYSYIMFLKEVFSFKLRWVLKEFYGYFDILIRRFFRIRIFIIMVGCFWSLEYRVMLFSVFVFYRVVVLILCSI